MVSTWIFTFQFFAFFFGRMRLKKHSEKTEDARPKREQRKRERASSGTRKSAALSRLVAKRLLARLARARKFVTKFLDEEGEVFADGRSNYSRKNTAENMCGDCRKLCGHRPKESAKEGRNLEKGSCLPRRVKRRSLSFKKMRKSWK